MKRGAKPFVREGKYLSAILAFLTLSLLLIKGPNVTAAAMVTERKGRRHRNFHTVNVFDHRIGNSK
jgi:hypothetical protein